MPQRWSTPIKSRVNKKCKLILFINKYVNEMYKLAIAGLLVETNKLALEMNKWKIWTTPSL